MCKILNRSYNVYEQLNKVMGRVALNCEVSCLTLRRGRGILNVLNYLISVIIAQVLSIVF